MTNQTLLTHALLDRPLSSRQARIGIPLLAAAGTITRQTRTVAAQDDLARPTLALDWYPNANHAGLYLAEARGYFTDESLEPEIYTPVDPTIVLQTVGAGRDDLGISYQTDVLLARAAGVPVVSVAALAQRPLLSIMSLAEAGITRPGDLAGQAIGITGIPSQDAILETMLAEDGVSLDEVELINVGFDLLPAIVSGRVAAVMGAYWTHETIVAERQGYEVEILRVEDWGIPSYYELVLVASEDTVNERPELVAAFVRAMSRGYLAALDEPDAALDALVDASPEVDRELEEQGIMLSSATWLEGLADDEPYGTQTAERWDAYATWMRDQGLISDDLDIAAAWTEAFVG